MVRFPRLVTFVALLLLLATSVFVAPSEAAPTPTHTGSFAVDSYVLQDGQLIKVGTATFKLTTDLYYLRARVIYKINGNPIGYWASYEIDTKCESNCGADDKEYAGSGSVINKTFYFEFGRRMSFNDGNKRLVYTPWAYPKAAGVVVQDSGKTPYFKCASSQQQCKFGW